MNGETGASFWVTRLVFQRALGFLYFIAFVNALNQFKPLLGEHGLLPVPQFVRETTFAETPSLFHFFPTDRAFTLAAWLGIILSCLALTGISDRFNLGISVGVWGAIWVLYLSFVNVGQTFYGFGWESILLEAGFYAMFLGPQSVAPPKAAIWLLRWLLFRIMFGAGVIKLRGDACWRDFTCLDYHYETQPMPNVWSWYFHWAPEWTHRAGVGFNHLAELIIPFGYFLPSPISAVCGIVTIIFQGLIMASGNLSWLNLLTLILAIPLLNDRWLGFLPFQAQAPPSNLVFQIASYIMASVIAVMSVNPIRNLLSPRQMMNFSYNPLHLASTYGAFGSITRPRYEIIIEGTDAAAVDAHTVWRDYEFKGKPGALDRRPPQIAPYHLRIDWLMWFAAMSSYPQHPWFVHLMAKLLQGDAASTALLGANPFPDHPPHFVRAELYEYHFATPAEHRATGAWWTRKFVGEYFPMVSLETPGFRRLLQQMDWL